MKQNDIGMRFNGMNRMLNGSTEISNHSRYPLNLMGSYTCTRL